MISQLNNKGSLSIEATIIIVVILSPVLGCVVLCGALISAQYDVDSAARDTAREVSLLGNDQSKVNSVANGDFQGDRFCRNSYRAVVSVNDGIAISNVSCTVNILGYTHTYSGSFSSPLNTYQDNKV